MRLRPRKTSPRPKKMLQRRLVKPLNRPLKPRLRLARRSKRLRPPPTRRRMTQQRKVLKTRRMLKTRLPPINLKRRTLPKR